MYTKKRTTIRKKVEEKIKYMENTKEVFYTKCKKSFFYTENTFSIKKILKLLNVF